MRCPEWFRIATGIRNMKSEALTQSQKSAVMAEHNDLKNKQVDLVGRDMAMSKCVPHTLVRQAWRTISACGSDGWMSSHLEWKLLESLKLLSGPQCQRRIDGVQL